MSLVTMLNLNIMHVSLILEKALYGSVHNDSFY